MKDAGIAVRSGGTDVHLVLVDLRDAEIDGKQAEDLLHEIHITVNRNAVPERPAPADGDVGPAHRHARRSRRAASATPSSPRSPTSSRSRCCPDADVEALRARVAALTAAFPLYPGLEQ